MAVTPDLTGFFAAAGVLRQTFGDLITFSVPQPPTWPAGTRINPDTNMPYSAMVVSSTPEFTQVTITASVILKEASPLRPQADSMFVAAGLMSGMDIILDVDNADYTTVQDATDFTYVTKNYHVEEFKPFEMANVTYRWLIYGKEK